MHDEFSVIAEFFPSLRGMPGVRPFDAWELDKWASHKEKLGPKPYPGHGAQQAAALVLHLYQHLTAWDTGPFQLSIARTAWNHAHRRAFTKYLFDARFNDGFDPDRFGGMEILEAHMEGDGSNQSTLGNLLRSRVADEREKELLAEGGVQLGTVVQALRQFPPSRYIALGFHNPHSYRGYYHELAFEPVRDTTVGAMLEAAQGAIGVEFEGYKGGAYKMTEETYVSIAHWGESDGRTLTGEMLLAMLCNKENASAEVTE